MEAAIHEVMPPGTPKRLLSPDISQHEPPMFIPRPSSERSQDVSHILASVFKDLYTRDVMSKETVQNLTRSSEGSTQFHKKCMKQLAKVHADHESKLQEYNDVEKHIIQARARAATADEKAMSHVAGDIGSDEYGRLGLPPVQSHFRWCVEEEKLKSHQLIIPSKIFTEDHQLLNGPKKSHQPHFALHTISSSLHFSKEKLDDGYYDDDEVEPLKEVQFISQDDDGSLTTLSSNSVDLISVPPRSSIKPKPKGQTAKNRWRENMSHETRIVDRALLARLEERHNFLKNPRFLPMSEPKASKLLTKQQPKKMVLKAGREVAEEVAANEEVQVFSSIPGTVKFTEWTVGRVYEATLALRNTSTVSRQLRVLPPKSPFFSLGLGKYPGSDGFVAPGMSAQYCIRFMPDSLSDYFDEVEIVSQSVSPLVVKIQARREPPILTMPENVKCGYCLVGGIKMTELTLKNMGGNGRFCILKKSSWPAANFKTLVNPGCLDLGTFQIRPSVFEVLAGQSVTIELFFSPSGTDRYREELVIICDNCQVKHFTIEGEGQSAAVELVSVSDGGEEEPKVGEVVDLTADHLVRFPPLNPHSFYMRQIIVHNSTNVEMPFTWHILKPNLTPALEAISGGKDSKWEKFDFYPDNESSFYVEPRVGVLQPNGIHEFVATFAPQQVGEFHNVFHLVLSNIPDPKRDVAKQKSPFVKSAAPPSVNGAPTTHHAQSPLDKQQQQQQGCDESAPRLSRSGSTVQSASSTRAPPLREVIALEVEVKGHSVPYSVVVHPPAVVVPGNLLVGATARRPMRMANYSMAPIEFQWSSETNPNIVEVEPPMGLINPGDVAELEVTITGSKPGPLSCLLECKIEHQAEPLSMQVTASIGGPNVVMDNMSINFGLIKVGSSACEKLFVRNTTQLNAQWTLSRTDQRESGDLYMWPSSGTLPPLGQQEVKIHFRPTFAMTLNTVFNLDVVGGLGSSITVKGDVQTQQVCFAECTLVLKETFVSVPKLVIATIINQTLFPTEFEFRAPLGEQSPFCDVTIYPERGVLRPREEKAIQVTFASHTTGEVTQVYIPCKIEGMKNPIVLGFYASINDLSVDFATPGTEGKDLRVQFDGSLKVGSTSTSKVVITNLTAIRAPWSAEVANFPCNTPQVKQHTMDFKSYRTRRMLLGRTPNLADPLSKTARQAFADHAKLMLDAGKGAAFLVSPERGFLEPYQAQEISVTAYTDMWGKYVDNLSCRIEGLDVKMIPIELEVVGCPLSYQVASQPEKDAVVRFGTHLDGGAPVARKLRINNSSSCDIRLDFRTYNYPELDDKKIVDLNIWFGDIFPLQVAKGHSRSRVNVYSSHNNVARKAQKEAHSGSRGESTSGLSQELSKLVTVQIEPHLGQKSERPFRMDPAQMIVPAHGHVMVTSVFQPMIDRPSEGRNGKEWRAFTRGFMTLDDPNAKSWSEEKLTRVDGLLKEPLRLELTAFVQAGMLRIETIEDDDEGSHFHLPLSDVINKDTMEFRESVQIQALTLSNPTETSLSFNLLLNHPFFFPSSTGKSRSLPRNLLKPQSNLKHNVDNLSVTVDALTGVFIILSSRPKSQEVIDVSTAIMTTFIYQWTFFVCCLYLVCTTEVKALPDNSTNLPPETTPSLVESPSSVLSVANVSVAVNLTVEPVVASTAGAVLKVTSSTKQSTTKPTLAPAKCPSRCKCVSIWVYCNNSGLTDVEGEFPIGTRAALLNHNKLTGLPKSTFQKVADSLVYIDFSYNQLATLKLDILFYATKLLALDLRHNQIVMTIGRLLFIPSFSNLKDLEYLNLAHNKLLFTTTQTFQSLSKLRTLILDNNQLRSSSLLDYRFAVSLQYLSLAGNKFQELKFHIETTATRLDVRDNLFAFNDTSQPFLLLKSLLDLKIGHPGVEYFPKTFTGLSSLKEIYFEKLSQAVLDNKILAPIIPSLKNFTVIGGNVSTISLFNFRSLANVNLFNLSRLETLQLRSMPIGDLPKIKLGNVTSLKYVKFVRLGFTTFKVDSQFPAGVKNLSLNSNKLKSLSANNLDGFSNLHHVDLGYNRIANVDNQTFFGLAYIQVVILSGNLLDRIDSFFLESPTLKRLDLSRNFISFISSKAFAKLPAIEAIDLSHNEIQSLPRISLSSIAAPQLVVQGNTWNCTCELYRQVKESNNYSVFCNSDLATMDCFVCSSPSNLFNKALSSLESVCKTKPRPTPTPTPLNTNFVIPLVCVLSVLIIIIFAILVWRFRCKQPRKATVRAPQLVFKQDATYEAVLYTAPPLKAGHAANTRLTNPYVFGNEADDKANAEMHNAYVLASETHQGKLQSGDDSSLPGNLYITANDAKTENVIDQKIPHDPYSVAKDPANSTGQPMAAQNPYVMASTKADNPYELPIAQPKVEYLTFDG